jgi:hypothetical protein
VSQALKTYYLPPIVKQLNEELGPVFSKLEKRNQRTVANKFIITLEYGRHGGIGARDELGALPPPAARFAKQGAVEPKNLFGRIQLSEKLLIGSRNDHMAFAEELTREIRNITNDAKDMVRRSLNGTSTGIMGTVKTAVTSGSTIAVNDGKIGYFYEGQIIDILTPGSAPTVSGAQIINVDRVAETFTLNGNVTVTAGQSITLAGNYGKELTGLGDILALDTTIYDIDRSANKWFNPVVIDKTSVGGFDSMWMREALDNIEDFSGEEPSFFVCDRETERIYIDEQNTYKRNIEYQTVDGGYKVISYAGIPISPEKYFKKGQMAILTLPNFVLARLQDWSWMDADGSILKAVSGVAAYEAVISNYCELLCNKPGSNALIKGITAA